MSKQIAIISHEEYPNVTWGETRGDYKLFPCHAAQLDILIALESFKYVSAWAGAQSGKSSLAPLAILKLMSLHKLTTPFNGLFVSPSAPVRQQSQIIEHMEKTFAGTNLQGVYHKSDRAYKFPNGNSILFRTADDPSKLDGGVYNCVILDEASKAEFTDNAWQRLKVRASAQNAPILTLSTPDMASPIYDHFIANTSEVAEGIRVSDDKSTWFMRVWKSSVRPGFSLEAIEEARKTMTPAMFSRMYEGIFKHFDGLVYDCMGNEKGVNYPIIPQQLKLKSPGILTVGAIDWGLAKDPAAVLIGVECEDGVIYIVDELYQTGLNNDELAEKIRQLKAKWEVPATYKFSDQLRNTTTTFFCDPEDPKAIQTMNNHGISAVMRRVKDILPGIATTNAMMKAGRLKIFDNCTNLIKELKALQWSQKRSGEYNDRTVGADHACDTLRYLVSSHMYGKRITHIDAVTAAVKEREAIEAGIRLNILPESADLRRINEQNAELKRQANWQLSLMNADE